jgi:hypothetical protein
MRIRPAHLAVALLTSSILVTGAGPAQAKGGGDDVVRRGSCTGSTAWKVKVKPDDGRLEVEAEVDSNRVGQTWQWRLVHDGSTSASGTRKTAAPSGSFEVRRLMVNRPGTDTITLRASNARTGERCVGTVRF